MVIFFGKRKCGRIHERLGVHHETLFACITLLQLPIVPIMTVRHRGMLDTTGERIPLSTASITRAYLTSWTFPLAFVCLFILPRVAVAQLGLVGVLAVELLGFAFGFLGITAAFWLGRSDRWSTAGRVVRWLSASFALFLLEVVIAAFGVKGLFA
jgi:hypothetical protein